MPPSSGEATLMTVYADVLYTFSPPEHKPPHYRFEKGSQVQLYQQAPEGGGRLGIINLPGTKEQEAVAGSLDDAEIVYSYKKSTTFSIQPAPEAPWKMPAFDPRQERRYMYPIQTIDVYFWSPEEALACLASLRAIDGIGHFELEDAPDEGHANEDTVSPIIERLEKAAINVLVQRRKDSASTGAGLTSHPGSYSLASTPITASDDSTAAFAPIAYTPSAPAAPEARVNREKTPPPLENAAAPGAVNGSVYQSAPNMYGVQQNSLQAYLPHPQATPPERLGATTASFPPPPPGSQPPASPPAHSIYHTAAPTPVPFTPPASVSPHHQGVYHHQQPLPPTNCIPGYFTGHVPQQQQQPQYHPMHTPQASSFQQQPHTPGFNPHQSPPHSPGYNRTLPTSPGFQQQPSQSAGLQKHPTESTEYQQQGYHQVPPASAGLPIASYPPSSSTPQPQAIYLPQATPTHQPSFPIATASAHQPHQQALQTSYSSYSYAQQPAQQQQQHTFDPGSVHHQLYQPTAAEAGHAKPPGAAPTGGWALRADKAEKGVNRFLKKLDKKW